jgi:hypothetical protein
MLFSVKSEMASPKMIEYVVFDFRLSLNFTIRDFACNEKSVFGSNGGEIVIWFLESLSCINSSKVILIFRLWRCVVRLGGSHAIILGGRMSLGPPWGVTGLAQRINKMIRERASKRKILVFETTPNEIRYKLFMPSNLPIVFGNEIIFF